MEKNFSPEQLSIHSERVKLDAKFIDEGSNFVADKKADKPRLKLSDKSMEEAKKMNDIESGNIIENFENLKSDIIDKLNEELKNYPGNNKILKFATEKFSFGNIYSAPQKGKPNSESILHYPPNFIHLEDLDKNVYLQEDEKNTISIKGIEKGQEKDVYKEILSIAKAEQAMIGKAKDKDGAYKFGPAYAVRDQAIFSINSFLRNYITDVKSLSKKDYETLVYNLVNIIIKNYSENK